MRKLATLRGLAIVLVVTTHATFYGMQALTVGWWGYRFDGGAPTQDWSWVGTPNYWGLIGLNQAGLFSVPLFLFASGFFVAFAARTHVARRITWTAVQSWLKNVVPPYLLWIAASVLLYVGLVDVTHRPLDLSAELARRLLDYFYVPLLVQFFLLSPALAWVGLRRPRALIAAAVLLNLGLALVHYLQFAGVDLPLAARFLNLWSWVVFFQWTVFFSLGIAVARGLEPLRRRLVPLRGWLAATAVVLAVASVLEVDALHRITHDYMNNEYWKLSTTLYSVVTILALMAWDLPRGRLVRVLDRLGSQSYGIYLLQPIALDYATKAIYLAAPRILTEQLILQPLLATIALGGPSLLILLSTRLPSQRYARVLFGT